MAFSWTDKKDDKDRVYAEHINSIAHELIRVGKELKNTEGLADRTTILENQNETIKEQHTEDMEYVNQNFANAVKGTLFPYAPSCVVEDVSPVPHIVKIRVASVYNEVVDTVVYVSDDSGTIKSYIPNTDGTVDGVTSFSPKMVIWAETQRENDSVNVSEIEYNKDINTVFQPIGEKLTELSTPKTAELIEEISIGGLRQVTRTEEPNGEPYNFKAMYVRYSTAMCTVKNLIRISFKTKHEENLCQHQFSNQTGSAGFISVHADVIGGMWQAIATAGITQGSPTGVQMWGRGLVPYGGETIKKIDILGTDTVFEDDATITIYGVR